MTADALSRSKPMQTEWMLGREAFQQICSLGAKLEADLFATGENFQIPVYIRLDGGGDGYLRDRLESVGSVKPVHPDFPVPESITTSQTFQREDSLHGGSHVAQQAIFLTEGTNNTVLCIEGLPHSEFLSKKVGRKAVYVPYVYLRSGERPPCPDFLSKVYERQFSKHSAQYLIKNLRTSSNRQYELIRSSWTQFIEANSPPGMQSDTAMKFLSHLFENMRLVTSTIVSYKCALRGAIIERIQSRRMVTLACGRRISERKIAEWVALEF